MSMRGIKFNFEPGEFVLCFEPDPTKARVIYEAKILDTTVYRDEDGKRKPGYHIHFMRWNNSWDRCVGEQLVLKSNDENKMLMKQLSEVAKRPGKNKMRRKMIHGILIEAFQGKNPFEHEPDEGNVTDTNSTDESTADTESIEGDNKTDESRRCQKSCLSVEIDIPDTLKAVLDRDYFTVNQDKKCVQLPAEINVVTVLESFVKTFMMEFWGPNYDRSYLCHNPPKIAIERILPICQEFVDGVRIYFDFTLPTILLYESEADQHYKLMNTYLHKSPAKQKIPADGSPLLTSPQSRTTPRFPAGGDESCPKLPKYSPSADDEDDEVSFNPNSPGITRRRVTRSTVDSCKKIDFDTAFDKGVESTSFKDDRQKIEHAAKQIRKRRSSDRQDDVLRRRALRSYRKSSEDSNESDQSKTDTIMSEPVKAADVKCEKEERPPPLLIPCNLVTANSRPQNGAEKSGDRSAPGSTDSIAENGKEILATILQWKLLPTEGESQLPTPPTLLYGSHHLLRLLVKFPDLLPQMNLDENRLGVLKKLLQQLLIYMAEHEADLFPENAYCSSWEP